MELTSQETDGRAEQWSHCHFGQRERERERWSVGAIAIVKENL